MEINVNDNVKSNRLNKIIQILCEKNGASIKHLSQELGVTEMTVRRDLETLQISKVVNLVHGAAILNPNTEIVNNGKIYNIMGVMDFEKDRMGKAAAALIKAGDVIIVDDGTTTVNLFNYLPAGLPISVICYSMNSLLAVRNKNVQHLVLIGGHYHETTQMFESPESPKIIREIRATKFFVSALGVSRELGLTCANQYEVATKKACIESSLQKILMVSSSKFDKVKYAYFGELNQVNVIITDNEISQEWRDILSEMNIQLIVV